MKNSESAVRTSILTLAAAAGLYAGGTALADGESVGPVISMPAMNTFRRYSSANPEPIFTFYSDILGHERLTEYDVGGATGVMRIRAGATELKFTGDTPGQQYQPGGVDNATGLRLWTFFYSDRDAVTRRFTENGLDAPEFEPIGDSGELSAIVRDPEGEAVQLIITEDPAGTTYQQVEIGLTVSDIDVSRAFYRDFVGLEELEPAYDPVFDTMKYSFRNGATIISLRHFGDDLPADTGTGGIQIVVSDVELVDRLAKERDVQIKQPLSTLQGFGLRTVWLGDPDGITNYFAQTGRPRAAAQ